MKAFDLTIATPDETVFSGKAAALSVRGTEGALSVLAGHIPFATAVLEGELSIISEEGIKKKARSSGGILSVGTDQVTFLTNTFSFEE